MKTIYAVIHGGEIIYVGQTVNIEARKYGHRHGKMRAAFLNGAEIKPLRECPTQNARRIEAQIIAAFQRRGLCRFNEESNKTRELKRKQLQWIKRYDDFRSVYPRIIKSHLRLARLYEAMNQPWEAKKEKLRAVKAREWFELLCERQEQLKELST